MVEAAHAALALHAPTNAPASQAKTPVTISIMHRRVAQNGCRHKQQGTPKIAPCLPSMYRQQQQLAPHPGPDPSPSFKRCCTHHTTHPSKCCITHPCQSLAAPSSAAVSCLASSSSSAGATSTMACLHTKKSPTADRIITQARMMSSWGLR